MVRSWILSALLGLACVSGAPPSGDEAPPPSPGERALAHLEALVALGPRAPGSEGAAAARAYLGAKDVSNAAKMLGETPFL